MSHFTVLVQIPKEKWNIEGYLEEVLAPFDENMEVSPYISLPKAGVEKKFEDAKIEYPESYADVNIGSFAKDWYGGNLDAEGNLLSTYNPQSKWDWWTIGGRWSNLLVNKEGEVGDYFQKKDLSFEGILENKREKLAKGWYESQATEESMRHFLYGIKPGTTREEHIASAKGLTTFAVITKSGEWCEKGKMGWWGMSSETEDEAKTWEDTYFKNFIETLDDEDGLVIVDCHI